MAVNPYQEKTWEWGCFEALDSIHAEAERQGGTNIPTTGYLRGWIGSLDTATHSPELGWLLFGADIQERWEQVGDTPSLVAMVTFLAEKQANYGTGNILRFRHQGLLVRCSDKIERALNIETKRAQYAEFGKFHESLVEPYEDCFKDLLGYCTIALMLLDGTFEYPLTRDLPVEDPTENVPREVAFDDIDGRIVEATMSGHLTGEPSIDDIAWALGVARLLPNDPELVQEPAKWHYELTRIDSNEMLQGTSRFEVDSGGYLCRVEL